MHSLTIDDDMIISWIKNEDIKNIRNFSKQINKIVIIRVVKKKKKKNFLELD